MNIIQINTVDTIGGAAQIVVNLHSAYKEAGHNSHVFVGYKLSEDPAIHRIPNIEYRKPWSKTFRMLAFKSGQNKEKIRTKIYRNVARLGELSRSVEVLRGYEDFDYPGTNVISTHLNLQPAILHGHNLHGGYFDLRQLPYLSGQFPFLLTLHDEWFYTGHCAYPITCSRWQDGCGSCPDLSLYPSIRRDATAYNLTRKNQINQTSKIYFAAPSKWLIDRAQDSILGSTGLGWRVIHCGVDLSFFKPANRTLARRDLGLPEQIPIVLFIAEKLRSSPYKDHKTIEQTFNILSQRNRKRDLLFVCLGEKSDDIVAGAARLRYQGRVDDRHLVAKYFQAADIYLHAANTETWGLAITEALGTGTPVIATEIGGIPEQVQDGINGFLVPPQDPLAMSEKVALLLDDFELRTKLGINASDYVHEKLGIHQMADKYIEYYNDIISSSNYKQSESSI